MTLYLTKFLIDFVIRVVRWMVVLRTPDFSGCESCRSFQSGGSLHVRSPSRFLKHSRYFCNMHTMLHGDSQTICGWGGKFAIPYGHVIATDKA